MLPGTVPEKGTRRHEGRKFTLVCVHFRREGCRGQPQIWKGALSSVREGLKQYVPEKDGLQIKIF